MGRSKSAGVELPDGVQAIRKASGKVYFYWAPKRGTKTAGKRIPLGSDIHDPEFWRTLRAAKGPEGGTGTFDRLIGEFKAHRAFTDKREATRRDYARYLDMLSVRSGDRLVADLSRRDVYRLLDEMQATPVAANHMLSVLQTIIEWGIPRDYCKDNAVIGVERLAVEGKGATPWPEEGYAFVRAHAPPDLARAAFLGRATGQRCGDLVRMKPSHLQADGIVVRIGKLRDKEHLVPLTKAELVEIKSWGVSPLDLFLKSTRNKPYSADHLGSRWDRWRESAEAAPVASLNMTLHGLRATKIFDLNRQGVSNLNISDEIGISVQMVSRYLRFSDKAQVARESRDRRENSLQIIK